MWHVCIGTEVTQAQRDVEELIRQIRERMKNTVLAVGVRSFLVSWRD